MRGTERCANRDPPPRPDATAFLNARLIDPASGKDEPGGLLVRDGVIADLGAHLRRNAPEGATVIDCKGHVLCPGLIDMQVFTGEPGQEHRETLKTASQAAAAGGVTTIVVMPDTEPVIDQVALVDFIQRRARDNAIVNVHVMAAMTRGLKGQEMTEIGLLKRAGAIAFTNGKSSVANTRVMRNVLLYAKDFGALIVHHTEDPHLIDGAVMNAGEVATRLGLPGVAQGRRNHRARARRAPRRNHGRALPCRQYQLRRKPGRRPRRQIAQTTGDLRRLRSIISRSTKTTSAPIAPFSDCARRCARKRTARRWCAASRPATSTSSSRAMIPRMPTSSGIPSPRPPTAPSASRRCLPPRCAFIITARSVCIPLLKAMTTNPAKLLGLASGRLAKGAPADLIVVDLGLPWVVDKVQLKARSKNSPFDESKMQGRVLNTMVAGNLAYQYASGDRS